MDLIKEIKEATRRINPHILKTPLFLSNHLSMMNGGKVYLKLESEQYTGSFKIRGALNKVLKIGASGNRQVLCTASTGNHAQGFASALAISDQQGIIYLPHHAEASKVEALKNYKVTLQFYGNNCLETEVYAKKMAEEKGMVWVSPYNDADVIAGQGTIGLEICEALDDIDFVLGTIGGGGMMSGISSWVKDKSPKTKVIGCLPENSPEMYLSVKQGRIIQLEEALETLSDGSAGGLEENSVTYGICKKNIDNYILVSEQEIASAIRLMAIRHHKIIEGAAGVALGGFIKNCDKLKERTVVIVICGSNISMEKLKLLMRW